MFAGENWGVIPDLITTAKGIASGVPMGAVLVKKEIAETISYGEQGTTFGGGPLACAAAKASLNIVLEERLFDNAKRMGDYIGEKLRPLKHIVELRGLGLLIGVVFDMPIKEIRNELLERGFIVGSSADPQVMRVMPPLIVKEEEVDLLTSNLREIVEAID